ncbi:1768_t:CDS:2, partial [Acaulospora morrowiae]
NFLPLLLTFEDFQQAWELLLSHLQDSCLYSNQEVAIASIRSLNTIIQLPEDEAHTDEFGKKIFPFWHTAWLVWEKIGLGIITASEKKIIKADNPPISSPADSATSTSSRFNQETLTAYIITFNDLYKILHFNFSIEEIRRLLKVVYGTLTYPSSPSYRPDHDYLTPLQEAVLDVVKNIDLNVPGAPAAVLGDLAEYITLAFMKKTRDEGTVNEKTDKQGKNDLVEQKTPAKNTNSNTKKSKTEAPVTTSKKSYETVTFIIFSKTSMRMVESLFKKFVKDKGVYSEGVFEKIIWAYGVPMKLKYNCPPSGKHVEDVELWKIATTAFLKIVKEGLIELEGFGNDISDERFVNTWKQLVDVIQGTLISNSHPPSFLKVDQHDIDEAFDMKCLFDLQTAVMVHMGRPRVPQDLIKKMVEAIKDGSRLYSTDVQRQGNGYLNRSPTPPNKVNEPHLKKALEEVEGVTTKIIPVAREGFA